MGRGKTQKTQKEKILFTLVHGFRYLPEEKDGCGKMQKMQKLEDLTCVIPRSSAS
jgi:hypothetical protein